MSYARDWGRTISSTLALSIRVRVTSRRMSSLLLTGGRVIDPANRIDAVADVLIRHGKSPLWEQRSGNKPAGMLRESM